MKSRRLYVWLEGAALTAQSRQECLINFVEHSVLAMTSDGPPKDSSSGTCFLSRRRLLKCFRNNTRSREEKEVSRSSPVLISLNVGPPNMEQLCATTGVELVERAYNGEDPPLLLYEKSPKRWSQGEVEYARLMVAERVTVQTGQDSSGKPLVSQLVSNAHGQWFDVAQQKLYTAPICAAEKVWYKAYPTSELQLMGTVRGRTGGEPIGATVMQRIILPAIQSRIADCDSHAVQHLAIHAGIVVVSTFHDEQGNAFYEFVTPDGVSTVYPRGTQHEPSGTYELWALRNATQWLPLKKMGLTGSIKNPFAAPMHGLETKTTESPREDGPSESSPGTDSADCGMATNAVPEMELLRGRRDDLHETLTEAAWHKKK